MKIKIILILVIVCITCPSISRAQEVVQGLKQVFDITADKLGNAIIEVSMKLNAQQWDYFKKTTGNNSNSVKRDMEKALPKYFLSDFHFTEDQMERTYKIKFTVLGFCTINKAGIWEAKLDTKNPDIMKISDKEWMITQDLNSDGVLLQQTQKIHLPESAKDGKVEKDSFGKSVLRYKTGTSMMPTILMIIGILLIAGGGFLLFKSKRTPVMVAK